MATQRAQIKSEIGILLSRLEILQKQVKDYRDLTQEINTSKGELEEVIKNINDKETELQAIQKEISEKEDTINSLNGVKEIVDKEMAELDKELGKLNKDIEARQESIEVIKAERKTISAAKKQEEKELENAKSKGEDIVKEQLREAESGLRKIETESHNADKELASKKEEIAKYEALTEQAKENLEKQENILHDKIVEVDNLFDRIEGLSKKEEELRERNKNLSQEGAELVRKNKQVEGLIEEGEKKLLELNN